MSETEIRRMLCVRSNPEETQVLERLEDPAGPARLLVASCCLLLSAGAAVAHESDYSYLRLRVVEERVEGEWEIHLRDARVALGLSADVTGEPAWSELRARASALRALLADRITFSTDAGECVLAFAEPFTERPGGRDHALLRFTADCPETIARLHVGYELLFDLDDAHRAFLAAEDAHQTHVGVFTAGQQAVTLTIRQLDRWRQFADYAREGVWHIALGLDHLLFLVALLLPAPMRRATGEWKPRESFGAVALEVVKIVSAFTLAHSITLTLAALGVARFPSRWVEASIALSVFAASWNNLRPFLPQRIWVLAFAFGLVHGLGFAAALAQLGLPRQAQGLALLAFNLGVEIGQLAIVAAVLPAIYAARHKRSYRAGALGFGSFGIAWLALIWLIERVFDLELIPII